MPHLVLDIYQGDGWIIDLTNGEGCVITDGETGNSAEPGQQFSNGDIFGTIEAVTYVRGWFGHFAAPGCLDQTDWQYAPSREELISDMQLVDAAELLKGGPGLDGYAYDGDVYCVDCGRGLVYERCEASTGDRYYYCLEDDAWDSDSMPRPIFFGESDHAQHCGNCGEYLYGEQQNEEMQEEEQQGE